jgi:hypothetical protein
MALANAYLTVTGNLSSILNALRNAQAPEKFTNRFLENLGFRSTNDRLIIGVLKALGFVDESGVPQQRYFDYLDESQSKRVLAQGIQEAYSDLFRVNNRAYELPQQEIKNKLKTLTQGTKSDAVLNKMTTTFVALCKQADFKAAAPVPEVRKPVSPQEHATKAAPSGTHEGASKPLNLAYQINIELPTTRDQAVYDAIFRSLKEHLL